MWVLSDRWCREADAEHSGSKMPERAQSRWSSVQRETEARATTASSILRLMFYHLARLLTSGPRGQLLTSDNVTLTVSAMLWHFSAPLMCPAIKIFLKWLGIYSLPVCTKCRHSKPAQPASAAQCWYERLNFLSLYTFSYCSKIYLLAEPGNFWSDEKSCFVAFYVAGWKKYCVYWMLKNNAIPKYLDYTISQSRLILLRTVLSHVLRK